MFGQISDPSLINLIIRWLIIKQSLTSVCFHCLETDCITIIYDSFKPNKEGKIVAWER